MTGESLPVLVDRLRAELDRLEAIARQAMVGSVWDGKQQRPVVTDGRWTANGCYVEGDHFEIYDEGGHTTEQAEHIAANDPAHVLRTIQAHRKIIDLLPAVAEVEERDEDEHGPLDVRPSAELLAALASIYFPESDGETS